MMKKEKKGKEKKKLRTRIVAVRLTDDEYYRLMEKANPQSISMYLRGLTTAERPLVKFELSESNIQLLEEFRAYRRDLVAFVDVLHGRLKGTTPAQRKSFLLGDDIMLLAWKQCVDKVLDYMDYFIDHYKF